MAYPQGIYETLAYLNNKVNRLCCLIEKYTVGDVTGSGTATQVAYWSSTSGLTSSSNFYWDPSTNRLGIKTSSPITTVDVRGSFGIINGTSSTGYPLLNNNLAGAFYATHASGNWGFVITRASTDNGGANIALYKTKNNDASIKTPVVAGDLIGRITWQAPDAGSAVRVPFEFGARADDVQSGYILSSARLTFQQSSGAYLTKFWMNYDGRMSFGTELVPTAGVHIAAGTATAGTAPLKLNSGTALTTPEDGAIEYHSSRLHFTTGGTRYEVVQQTPTTSAELAVTSTTKGFLPPRMTGTQAEAIATPAEGLMVYSTDGSGTTITSKGWWGFEGATWVKLN